MGTTESILYDEEEDDEGDEDEEAVTAEQRTRMPSAHPSQHSRTRSRPRPVRPATTTQALLHGCVLGMSKSGKTSLLERFQGREPIDRRSEASRNDEGAEEDETIHIPYQAPKEAPTWHDRIRLHVTALKKLHHDNNSTYDFYILLFDPRKSMDKLQKYITKTLRAIVKKQREGPLCLCLLRNFRDAIGTEQIASQQDVTSWTLECLSESSMDSNRLVLLQTDISLMDCYGLPQLHQFIYQSYAQFHVEHLHRQISLVRAAQRQLVSAQVPYETFRQEMLGTRTASEVRSRRTILPDVPPQPEVTAKSTDALEAFLESSDEGGEEDGREPQEDSVDTASNDGETADDSTIADNPHTETNEPEASNVETPSPRNSQEQETVRKVEQTPEPSSKEGPPAAGEPTEDMSKPAVLEPTEAMNKPAIQDAFFDNESDHDDDVVEAAPLQTANGSDNDSDDDDEFFISHIDPEEDTGNKEHEIEDTRKVISSSNDVEKAEPDYNPEIKAALEAAKEDFERMLKEKDSKPAKKKKSKKNKDSEKKKRKESEKKQKKRLSD